MPVDIHGGLSTAKMVVDRKSKLQLHIGVSTYLLHPNTSCKLRPNIKELKNSTIKIFHALHIILHIGEDFSNLNRTK